MGLLSPAGRPPKRKKPYKDTTDVTAELPHVPHSQSRANTSFSP
jgi:hypothetical protein